MLPLKLRLKILNKIAQTVPGAPPSPASPTSPTAPTTPDSTTEKVVQPPQPFNVASGSWGWVSQAYNSTTVGYLNVIANMINTLMHYSTGGEHSMVRNQNNLDSLSVSGKTSDGINAIKLAQLFYKTFINSGQAIKPSSDQIQIWADSIANSPPLLELAKLNPTGKAAQQMKLNDSFRQTIVNNLGHIKEFNKPNPTATR